MGSIYGEESVDGDMQDSSANQEKIFVAVRMRPLNERELAKNDVSVWECINNTTIIFKNTLQERSMLPAAYTFDGVFGCDSPTIRVYNEAAKKIVLSVLNGMNSTIFAYGQTSSGKTYTMTGITEYAVADLYDYITKHPEREFLLKFSAMEIYNEAVKDLLCLDGAPLRLLDDPERGTIVDKLTEVVLRDFNHLKELLSICEAQRQIGETNLNETSSRSHQILRLTVDSEARSYFSGENSSTLSASVNFVDLAGSERASQTSSAGTRLKEGCHINRSLLTLGTVIRKLSKGRNGHIPYRDSKLTRILQHSLGGNARTAIICTMSPAHSHVEQSRNTLLFASCAKQVSTNAQVNVVMSEKALVKQLQRELARLENELRNLSSLSASGGSSSALKEKELLIEKMDKEIRELTYQRDIAQSRVENMLQSKTCCDLNSNHEKGSWTDEYPASEASEIIDPLRSDVPSGTYHFHASKIEDQFLENNEEQFLSDDTSPRLYIDKYFGPDPCKGWEKIAHQETDKSFEENCKEVQCIEIDFTKRSVVSDADSPQKFDYGLGQSPYSSDNDLYDTSANVSRSKSCAAILTTISTSPGFEVSKENETRIQIALQNDAGGQKDKFHNVDSMENSEDLLTNDSRSSIINEKEEKIRTWTEDSTEKKQEDIVKELSEAIKPKIVKQVDDDVVKKIKPRSVKQDDDDDWVKTVTPRSVKHVDDDSVKITKPKAVKGDGDDDDDLVKTIKPESVRRVDDSLKKNKPKSVEQVEKQDDDDNWVKTVTPRSFKHVDDDSVKIMKPKAVKGDDDDDLVKTIKPESVRQVDDDSVKKNKPESVEQVEKQNDDDDWVKTVTPRSVKHVDDDSVKIMKPKAVKGDDDDDDDLVKTIKPESVRQVDDDSVKKIKPESVEQVENDSARSIKPELLQQAEDDLVRMNFSAHENPSFLETEDDAKTPETPEQTTDSGLDEAEDTKQTGPDWYAEFERQRRDIIELWDACNTPLIHRSYFFLLFKGDPSDAVYMEVELRRLLFLKGTLHGVRVTKDDQFFTQASSSKALNREREMLSKQMLKKFSTKEREDLYQKWDIDVKSKQRRLQLCRRLWSDTTNMEHIKEGAALVAKLVGFKEPGQAPKEMFGLSFTPERTNLRTSSWRHSLPL